MGQSQKFTWHLADIFTRARAETRIRDSPSAFFGARAEGRTVNSPSMLNRTESKRAAHRSGPTRLGVC